MLKQNADQVLGLVRETFVSSSLSDPTPEENCTNRHSIGGRLSCLWTQAADGLKARNIAEEDKLALLTKVSY